VTFNDPVFKAFNDFDLDDMPAQADISRRMLRRLKDIDNSTPPVLPPQPRAPHWQPASSHTPWLNSRPNS
jgi:hypothetical protein